MGSQVLREAGIPTEGGRRGFGERGRDDGLDLAAGSGSGVGAGNLDWG